MAEPENSADIGPLASLVGDTEQFFATTFGRHPWQGRAVEACELFGVDDVDSIVASSVRAPAVRMVGGGDRIPTKDFCSPTRIGSSTLHDTADARKVLDLYRRGATLVLQSLQRTWPPLVKWCCRLEAEVGWPVQANAYLSPAHSRGLDRHSDGHDVFVLQLHGSKRWEVDGLVTKSIVEGDVLYIPSGTEHVAETEADPSLHLTIGLHRPSDERIARAAFDLASERREERRQGETTLDASSVHLSRLADEFSRVSLDEAVEHLRRPPRRPAFGALGASIRREPLEASTRLRTAGRWQLESIGDRVSLDWPGGRLFLPIRCEPALSQLVSLGDADLAIGQLDGLDDDERMVLARRLLDEGAAVLA